MKNVDINKERLEKQAERKKKLLLRRLKTVGLIGAGALFVTIGFKQLPDFGQPDKNFEFDQDSVTNDDLANEYIDQFENATGYEMDDVNTALLLANFDIAYDNYINSVKQDKQLEQVEARIKLVSATNELVRASSNIIDAKTADALDIENGTANVKRLNHGEEDVIIVDIDGEKMTYSNMNLPKEMKAVMNDIGRIEEYKGTGESNAWEKAIDKYSDIALDLYNDTVELSQQEYTFVDGELKNVNRISK